jgi:hypothetical protein
MTHLSRIRKTLPERSEDELHEQDDHGSRHGEHQQGAEGDREPAERQFRRDLRRRLGLPSDERALELPFDVVLDPLLEPFCDVLPAPARLRRLRRAAAARLPVDRDS